jgi:hypothetical protein
MIESIVSGRLSERPHQRIDATGRPFITATVRVLTGDENQPYRHVKVNAYGDKPKMALLGLEDGEAMAVTGTLSVWTAVNSEGTITPRFCITAVRVMSLYRAQEREESQL